MKNDVREGDQHLNDGTWDRRTKSIERKILTQITVDNKQEVDL